MPSFPDNLLGARFPLLCLNAPTPGDLRGNREVDPRTEVSMALNDLCNAIDPDSPWLPGLNRLEIVNNQRHFRIACHYILILACSLKAVTSNVETRAVELEANGIEVELAGKPALALKTSNTSFFFQEFLCPCLSIILILLHTLYYCSLYFL